MFKISLLILGLSLPFTFLKSDILTVDHNSSGVFDEGEAFVDVNGNDVYDPESVSESYMDANGNGIWDQNEPFNDINANGIYDGGIGGEYFVDVDGNGQWDPAEILIVDYDGDGEWDEGVYGDNPNTSYWEQTYELQPPDVYYDANNNGQYDIQEHYIDTNGNGEYDSYDPNLVSGEPFVDNENGVYDEGEEFTDGNGVYDEGEVFTDGNGVYDEGEEFTDGNGVYDEGEEFIDALNGVYDIGEEFTDENQSPISIDYSGVLGTEDIVYIGSSFDNKAYGYTQNIEAGSSITFEINATSVIGSPSMGIAMFDSNNKLEFFGVNSEDLRNGINTISWGPFTETMYWEFFIDLRSNDALLLDNFSISHQNGDNIFTQRTFANGVYDVGEVFVDALNGVYDEGEEFTDELNGVYDVGEVFVDAPNGVYDEGETFTDLNGNGLYDSVLLFDYFIDTNGNGIFDLPDQYVDTNQNGIFDEPQPGGRFYVNKSSADNGDGGSWDTAFKYLSDALEIAGEGSEIWIAEGVYYTDESNGAASGNNASTFLISSKDITLIGGFKGDETDPIQRAGMYANRTILTGKLGFPSNWSNHILKLITSGESSLNLDTITIEGAKVSAIEVPHNASLHITGKNCIFRENSTDRDETGAVFSNRISGEFFYSAFEQNLCISGPDLENGQSSVFYNGIWNLVSCIFFNNQSLNFPAVAMFGEFDLTNCVLTANATQSDTCLFRFPTALNLYNTTITNNFGNNCVLIKGNNSINVTVLNCIIKDNNPSVSSNVNYKNAYDLIETPFTLKAPSVIDGYGGNGLLNSNSSLEFIDSSNPKGTDQMWFTSDDGLIMNPASYYAGKGSINFLRNDYSDLDRDGIILEPLPFDIRAMPRVNQGTLDLGAYAYISPDNADDDNDGLSNYEETLYGSDPLSQDTSGDGFNDKLLVDLNLDPTVDYSALNFSNGLYSLNEIKDLRAGSTMIEIHNGQATLTMEVEQSDDLGVWTNGSATSIQIPIDAEAGKKFFRFKMAE